MGPAKTTNPDDPFQVCSVLKGPKWAVELAWSNDGKKLAASFKDRVVRVWATEDGCSWRQTHELKGHTSWIHTVSWSDDGARLASASEDHTVRVWNLAVPGSAMVLQHSAAVPIVAWRPGRDVLASACGWRISFWDTVSGKLIQASDTQQGAVSSLAWAPGGRLLATGSRDGRLRLIRYENGAISYLPSPDPVSGHAIGLAWSPERRILACGWSNSAVLLFDVEANRFTRELQGHRQGVCGVAFSADGLFLASAAPAEPVRLWRRDNWDQAAVLPIRTPRYFPFGLDFSPKRPQLAVVDDEGASVKVWNINTEMLLGAAPTETTVHYSNAKVVLVGDTGVGKTGLGLLLTGQPFQPTVSTHGRSVWLFSRCAQDLGEGREEQRETFLWDLAGQPGYRLVHQLSLREAALALIVFDSRSATDPFAGVYHWARALRLAESRSLRRIRKFLVAARVDRGGIAVTSDRIKGIIKRFNLDGYFETSAMTGQGIPDLIGAIEGAIRWDDLPKVSSSTLFERIRLFLLKQKDLGWILSTVESIYQTFVQTRGTPEATPELRDQFRTCIELAQSRGLLYKFSFGDFVLMKPELLDGYASALIHAATEQPDGLGSIPEEEALEGKFRIPDECRVSNEDQKLLLAATIKELIGHEIALREPTAEGQDLVFPSQFAREWPEAPDPPGKAVVYRFEGPVMNIYSTLCVRLSRSGLLTLADFWKNAAVFRPRTGGVCGIYVREFDEGRGEITVFYDQNPACDIRLHFDEYVETHLKRRALPQSVERQPVFACGQCGTIITPAQAQRRRERGFDWIGCPVCERRIALVGETPNEGCEGGAVVDRMDVAAEQAKQREEAISISQQKRAARKFDVFLCHNGEDKPRIREIHRALYERGILAWLDEKEIQPGRQWERALEEQLSTISCAAVFVGSNGIAPWHRVEIGALLSEFVNRECSVIPVLLEGAPSEPSLPLFLRGHQWVDFRNNSPDPLEQLIWGITGEKNDSV